jgi:ubiquitin-protein ligase
MSAETGPIVLKKDTIMRLIKDVKEMLRAPLISHGVYYQHDEINLLKGYALVIGSKDTPYENGYYFFELDYPANYPHSPPKVKYYTNDGYTRFNPNLYKCGKVCLSILNTWRGDQWSACQTISSVLLALCTVFNDNPLLNEPGVTTAHPDVKKYNKVIQYKNYEIAIMQMVKRIVLAADLDENTDFGKFIVFKDILKTHFLENYVSIKDKIAAAATAQAHAQAAQEAQIAQIGQVSTAAQQIGCETLYIGIYSMTINIYYSTLLTRFQEMHAQMA